MCDLPGTRYCLLHFPGILCQDHGQEVFPLFPLLFQSESSSHQLHSLGEVMGSEMGSTGLALAIQCLSEEEI